MNKHRIRKVVLFSILGVLILAAVLKLSIEPSDYYNSLGKEVKNAQTLICLLYTSTGENPAQERYCNCCMA